MRQATYSFSSTGLIVIPSIRAMYLRTCATENHKDCVELLVLHNGMRLTDGGYDMHLPTKDATRHFENLKNLIDQWWTT